MPLFWLIIPFLGEHFYAIIITFKPMFWKTGAFVSSVRLHLTVGRILDLNLFILGRLKYLFEKIEDTYAVYYAKKDLNTRVKCLGIIEGPESQWLPQPLGEGLAWKSVEGEVKKRRETETPSQTLETGIVCK